MKKNIVIGSFLVLISLIIGFLTLYYIDKQKEKDAYENNKRLEAEANAKLQKIKSQTISTFVMHDSEGKEYVVYFYSPDAKEEIQSFDWVGASKGDIIYRGSFNLAVQPSGKSLVNFSDKTFKDFYYNLTRKTVYVITGPSSVGADILVVSKVGSSSGNIGYFFYIINGELKPILIDGASDEFIYLGRPKKIGDSLIQTAHYINTPPFGYLFKNYQFDEKTGILKEISKKEYFGKPSVSNLGQQIYYQWSIDPNYVVN